MDSGSILPVPLYIVLIVLFILGGAYFAMAETAFASVNTIRIISDADDGDPKAKKALQILENPDKALTIVLIGNNIMHIACSSVATLMASKIWGNAAVTVTTFITSFTVFILAEMIPKSYAKACSEKLAPRLAPSLGFFIKILSPVSFLFSGISDIVSKIAKSPAEEEVTVSEEELFDIIENIDEKDEIDEDTTELVQSALEFTVKTAADILVPWDKVETIDDSMPTDEITNFIISGRFSRYPVTKDGEIIGILQSKKYLKAKIRGRKVLKSKSVLDKVHFVKSTMNTDDLREEMSSCRTHFSVVKNENNQIIGILTMEDILEELVGEIYDEKESKEKGGAAK